ncbi:hypothetical protein [Tumebacillus permanentifrigoris]|uniref:Phr family secreted Rap phosphatase inhibitor n=1 Tax=Tumebacillus permanentifrigoris TaxID=378543 RepID=A0A316D2S0_9BACL|nr:hypothetical protein [Tumebacillus permanentifrigoris]PWK05219.1 hypothetical protein C7459_12541 [Tumebacillus permanentifrigoris]
MKKGMVLFALVAALVSVSVSAIVQINADQAPILGGHTTKVADQAPILKTVK